MAHQSAKSYQAELVRLLAEKFTGSPVEAEWKAIQDIRGLYSPRVDVAVGPFSTVLGGGYSDQYNDLAQSHQTLIDRLIGCHREDFAEYQNDRLHDEIGRGIPTIDSIRDFNWNARCFIAVEIENQVSRKHLLGGVVNASALARIGIVVPWTVEKLPAVVKLLQYWDFLAYVKKNSFRTDNVLVLTPSQLEEALP